MSTTWPPLRSGSRDRAAQRHHDFKNCIIHLRRIAEMVVRVPCFAGRPRIRRLFLASSEPASHRDHGDHAPNRVLSAPARQQTDQARARPLPVPPFPHRRDRGSRSCRSSHRSSFSGTNASPPQCHPRGFTACKAMLTGSANAAFSYKAPPGCGKGMRVGRGDAFRKATMTAIGAGRRQSTLRFGQRFTKPAWHSSRSPQYSVSRVTRSPSFNRSRLRPAR